MKRRSISFNDAAKLRKVLVRHDRLLKYPDLQLQHKKDWVLSEHTMSHKGYSVKYPFITTACRGHRTSHFETRKLRPETIWDKSLAWALMAGKSISGWNRLALGPWASCYVKWLFSPKGSGIFWAKAFWRETNLSGGRASNNTQSLAPWKEGAIKCCWAQQLPRRVWARRGRSASLAHLRAAGRPGRHCWNAIAYLLALPELKWGYLRQLLWKEHASESSEKRMACWCPGFPRHTVTATPREGSPASQMRGKESQQSPK